MTTNGRTVTVFGGTGFLGRRIVQHLRDHEFPVRIASRHPDRGRSQFGPHDSQLLFVRADIQDERSVANALAGAYAAVNTVSLYVEHGRETFHSVHVESAQRVAAQAHRAGVKRLVHLSGIGADAASRSRYIRARGEGELVVRATFAGAHIIRPAVMFGPDDAFLTTILNLLRRLPIYPMFGRGSMKLQPAYVEDVAEATVRIIQRAETQPTIFECGGPRVYSYEELVAIVARQAGLAPILVPIPLAVWHALAWASEVLPNPILTRNQVELMQIDTVSSPGLVELGISPQPVEAILQKMLSKCG
ncbi:complex I NDUFA9 subunit family protein [Bradyrhizobium sp. CCBAU 53421]|uniref:complex I NDUFA9 subunit family protein n=1 Tax=Bradyrhizobium sp. CCBAU 53421 TaxID=1325120 RepID=UPI00188AA2B9|nr:complex I NDUFA9 subunit family protein [Bradyrhizobium sp. CCBAU 53421]QOZ38187.1 complex I NDUFA9 subunit family protein [Bradyrhizobium sp. CCBAU 53421]